MNINIRYAKTKDLNCLFTKDDVDRDWAVRCINNKEYIIAELNKSIIGFLRFSMFWGKIPYMDMIRVEKDKQSQGVGTSLYIFWEKEMIIKGASTLMTSSVKNEKEPQAWHKRNGFKKVGEISFGKNIDDKEIFMIKNL